LSERARHFCTGLSVGGQNASVAGQGRAIGFSMRSLPGYRAEPVLTYLDFRCGKVGDQAAIGGLRHLVPEDPDLPRQTVHIYAEAAVLLRRSNVAYGVLLNQNIGGAPAPARIVCQQYPEVAEDTATIDAAVADLIIQDPRVIHLSLEQDADPKAVGSEGIDDVPRNPDILDRLGRSPIGSGMSVEHYSVITRVEDSIVRHLDVAGILIDEHPARRIRYPVAAYSDVLVERGGTTVRSSPPINDDPAPERTVDRVPQNADILVGSGISVRRDIPDQYDRVIARDRPRVTLAATVETCEIFDGDANRSAAYMENRTDVGGPRHLGEPCAISRQDDVRHAVQRDFLADFRLDTGKIKSSATMLPEVLDGPFDRGRYVGSWGGTEIANVHALTSTLAGRDGLRAGSGSGPENEARPKDRRDRFDYALMNSDHVCTSARAGIHRDGS
jgi:hypothetical protein